MDALIASAGPLRSSKYRSNGSQPSKGRRKPLTSHKTVDRGPTKESIDPSTHSILGSTRLPKSFHDQPYASITSSTADLPVSESDSAEAGPSGPSKTSANAGPGSAGAGSGAGAGANGHHVLRPDPSISRIKDKKLRARIAREDVSSQRAKIERIEVNEWLNAPLAGSAGGVEVDEEAGEKTWSVRQGDIAKEVGVSGGRRKFDLKFDGLGEYMLDYTRNGR